MRAALWLVLMKRQGNLQALMADASKLLGNPVEVEAPSWDVSHASSAGRVLKCTVGRQGWNTLLGLWNLSSAIGQYLLA